MQLKKTDFAVLLEHEEKGLVAAMDCIVERNRTKENIELSDYFRSKLPNYNGTYGEEDVEDVLCFLNQYIKEKKLRITALDFPLSSGSEVYLLPISTNLNLKVLVVDEYLGDGEYSKYVDISFFLINEHTAFGDIEGLVEFTNEFLNRNN